MTNKKDIFEFHFIDNNLTEKVIKTLKDSKKNIITKMFCCFKKII